ncbi:MAG: hypothetical protein AAGC53_12710 [Actinomycetota bacterium]
MRVVLHAPDRVHHLLIAMAADASDLDLIIEFVATAEQLPAVVDAAVESRWPPDAVMVISEGDAGPLDAVASIDRSRDWSAPIVVASTRTSDAERLCAYAAGADWYQEMPSRFSQLVELIEFLVVKAAIDLVDEVETYLLAN